MITRLSNRLLFAAAGGVAIAMAGYLYWDEHRASRASEGRPQGLPRLPQLHPVIRMKPGIRAPGSVDGQQPKGRPGERPFVNLNPMDGVGALLEAFDRYPIVALGEVHGLEQERQFIAKVVRDPRFPDKVNDVVVEFGNARFQGLVDRYIAGEDVAAAQLQCVWREHTCPGPWKLSSYPKYFALFREVNQSLPPARRFRVLLGDPPIDWQAIRSREDLGLFLALRDSHAAQVIEEQVLSKGHRALVIYGSDHLLRRPVLELEMGGSIRFTREPGGTEAKAGGKKFFFGAPAGGGNAGNLAQLIEKKHPGQLFIVLPHDGLGEGSREMENLFLASWPVSAVAPLKGTRLGALAANQVTTSPQRMKLFVDGKVMDTPKPDPAKGPRLEEIADALLYLGPRKAFTLAPETDYAYDQSFVAELKRREEAIGGLMPPPADTGRQPARRNN